MVRSRVSSEQNVSQKNAKIFGRISQTFSRNFAKMNEAKTKRKCENFAKIFFSRNFRIIFSQNRLKQNFAKNAKFSRNGFSFSLETLVRSKALYGNKIFSKKVSLYS